MTSSTHVVYLIALTRLALLSWNSSSLTVQPLPTGPSTLWKHLWRDRLCRTAFFHWRIDGLSSFIFNPTCTEYWLLWLIMKSLEFVCKIWVYCAIKAYYEIALFLFFESLTYWLIMKMNMVRKARNKQIYFNVFSAHGTPVPYGRNVTKKSQNNFGLL